MDESPFDSLVDAFRDAKGAMAEVTKTVKADVIRPADPNAEILTRQQRIADLDHLLANPDRLESEFMFLRNRYKIPEGTVPRRLVDRIVTGLKEKARKDRYG